MKKVFIFLLLLIGVTLFSQDYHFKYRRESISYRIQNGQIGSKQLSNESGDYLFRYENTYSNGKYEKIFTVFKNGQESFYCVETSNKGNREINGIIFQQSFYFHTGTSEVINVLFSLDHNRIVIMDLEGMAEYYN